MRRTISINWLDCNVYYKLFIKFLFLATCFYQKIMISDNASYLDRKISFIFKQKFRLCRIKSSFFTKTHNLWVEKKKKKIKWCIMHLIKSPINNSHFSFPRPRIFLFIPKSSDTRVFTQFCYFTTSGGWRKIYRVLLSRDAKSYRFPVSRSLFFFLKDDDRSSDVIYVEGNFICSFHY